VYGFDMASHPSSLDLSQVSKSIPSPLVRVRVVKEREDAHRVFTTKSGRGDRKRREQSHQGRVVGPTTRKASEKASMREKQS
jgi:hypothetical protein